MNIYCSKCETANKEGARSCVACGSYLGTAATDEPQVDEHDILDAISNKGVAPGDVEIVESAIREEYGDRPSVVQQIVVINNQDTSRVSRQHEAKSKANSALVLAIVGLFVFGPILGILGLLQAAEARRLSPSVDVSAATVLCWVDIIIGSLLAFFLIGSI